MGEFHFLSTTPAKLTLKFLLVSFDNQIQRVLFLSAPLKSLSKDPSFTGFLKEKIQASCSKTRHPYGVGVRIKNGTSHGRALTGFVAPG